MIKIVKRLIIILIVLVMSPMILVGMMVDSSFNVYSILGKVVRGEFD